MNEPLEEWRRQIDVHLRQAGVPVSLPDLGKAVKRPAGVALTRKLGQVLDGDRRFVLEGSGDSITVRSSEAQSTSGGGKKPGSKKSAARERLYERYKETASAFWETLCGDTALRLRCRDQGVFDEQYRAWKRQMEAQGVRYIGSPGGILHYLSRLGHLRPSSHRDVLFFVGDGMGAEEVVREVLRNREDTENDRGGIVILPREVKLHVKEDGTYKVTPPGVSVRQEFVVENLSGAPVQLFDVILTGKARGDAVTLINAPGGSGAPVELFDVILTGKARGDAFTLINAPGGDAGARVVNHGGKVRVSLDCLPVNFGTLRALVSFHFRSATNATFAIGRFVTVRCGNADVEDLVKPTAPYQKKRFLARKHGPVEEGQKPQGDSSKKFKINLATFHVPQVRLRGGPAKDLEEEVTVALGPMFDSRASRLDFKTAASEKGFTVGLQDGSLEEEGFAVGLHVGSLKAAVRDKFLNPADILPAGLRGGVGLQDGSLEEEVIKCQQAWPDNAFPRAYPQLMHHLLHVEELKMQVDIQQFDMPSSPLIKNSNYIALHVPGLAESRPSVLRGDQVLVSRPGGGGKKWSGYAHRIEQDQVLLKFRRTPLWPMHLDLDKTSDPEFPREILFPPSIVREDPPRSFVPVMTTVKGMEVRRIVAGRVTHVPYVLFGPPGTGKTTTLVETILQLAKTSPPSFRILVMAPTNTASDIFVVSEDVKKYCNFDRESNAFPMLPVEKLKTFKVLVATTCTAAKLFNAGFERGDFAMMCIDECGNDVEPGVMAPIQCLLASGQQRVLVMAPIECLLASGQQLVLAGDPRQLGPVVRSPFASLHGLSTSLLERVVKRSAAAGPRGDPRQLGPVVRSPFASLHGLSTSLLERVMDFPIYALSPDGKYDPRVLTMLVKNYRSHPHIIAVPNERFT
ncbi:hypothetical protein T484DRAFT_1841393 [Baffinella frigidus]|nr:hypothetical protein T484DRAFT_1841393 [Cryptophyta sp. CCMP2293]